MMMLICIKQLSAQFIRKLSNTEVELKKVLVIKHLLNHTIKAKIGRGKMFEEARCKPFSK